MAMSAEHRSKFAVFQRHWWRLPMSEKFSSGTKTPYKKNIYEYKKVKFLFSFTWLK